MSKKEQHNLDDRLPEEWEEIAHSSEPKFAKSKEQVWDEMMADLEENSSEPKVIQLNWFRYAAAAVVILMLGSVSFLRFYSESILVPAGQHASVDLPDGSKVELNAASQLSYHPYWWNISRSVDLEGEAFFDVEKGSKFQVNSETGTTEVLGTSFNINSRHGEYKVFCKTGKVNVSNASSSVVLKPNELAFSDVTGNLGKTSVNNEDEFLGWIDYKFVFNATPMEFVLEELEFQFDVEIKMDQRIKKDEFTGSFQKADNVKETLEVISNSMGLKFEQNSIGNYSLTKRPD